MRLDTRTIYLVADRLTRLASAPRLFDDRMTPARVSRRLARVFAWLGPSGRAVVSERIRRGSGAPPPGTRQWQRHGLAPTLPLWDNDK